MSDEPDVVVDGTTVSVLTITDGTVGQTDPQTEEAMRRFLEEQSQVTQRGRRLYFPASPPVPIIQLTPDTEALLGLLLRPQGRIEILAVAVLRAVLANDRKEGLAAAAALADAVKEEME